MPEPDLDHRAFSSGTFSKMRPSTLFIVLTVSGREVLTGRRKFIRSWPSSVFGKKSVPIKGTSRRVPINIPMTPRMTVLRWAKDKLRRPW
jgi:hypothetical protein